MVALLRMPNRFEPGNPEDRRLFPRKQIYSQVAASRIDRAAPVAPAPQVTMALRDLSLGGMSALSPAPLDQGEQINVFFPPLGSNGGWDARGRVIRCSPSAMGFRVAVEFDPIPMAA